MFNRLFIIILFFNLLISANVHAHGGHDHVGDYEVSNLAYQNDSNSSIILNWENPTEVVVDHLVVYKDSKIIGTSETMSYTDVGLEQGKTYYYTVTVVDDNGQESQGKSLTVLIDDSTPPSEVKDLTYNVTETTVTFDWFPPLDEDFSHVNVYMDGDLKRTTSSNTYFEEGLTQDSSYSFTFVTVDVLGNESVGHEEIVKTNSYAPEVATDLDVYGITDKEVRISWVEGDNVEHYEIKRNNMVIGTTKNSFYIDGTIADYSVYEYSVTSVNGSKGVDSNSIYVKTDSGKNLRGITIDNVTDTSVELSWEQSLGDVNKYFKVSLDNGFVSMWKSENNFSMSGLLEGTQYIGHLISKEGNTFEGEGEFVFKTTTSTNDNSEGNESEIIENENGEIEKYSVDSDEVVLTKKYVDKLKEGKIVVIYFVNGTLKLDPNKLVLNDELNNIHISFKTLNKEEIKKHEKLGKLSNEVVDELWHKLNIKFRDANNFELNYADENTIFTYLRGYFNNDFEKNIYYYDKNIKDFKVKSSLTRGVEKGLRVEKKDGIYVIGSFNNFFDDVEDTHWASEVINFMSNKHFVNGTGDAKFEPNKNITRAEFVSMLVKSLGYEKESISVSRFEDINKDDWYYDSILIVEEMGLISGKSAVEFGPSDLLTREQMIALIIRVMEYNGESLSMAEEEEKQILGAYRDEEEISSWAYKVVAQAVKFDVTVGKSEDELEPKSNSTRAEAITFVYRVMTKGKLY